MTVIRPNSVSGITSITAQANDINFFRSNGTLAGLNLNGVNFNTTSGVSTFAALNIEGVLTYQDVTNVDSVGIITARSTIDAQGDVSIADKIIHTGDTNTAIRFPAADTISFETAGSERLNIASNGDVTITNTSSNPQLALISANDGISEIQFGDGNDSVRGNIVYRSGSAGDALCFNGYNNTERLRITSAGRVGINQTTPEAMLQIDYDYANSEVGLRLRSASGSGTKTWQLSEINGNAGVFTIRNATNSYNILNIDGANQRVGINKTNPERELHILGGSDACIRLTCTDGGVASLQLGDASDTVIGGLTLNAADNSIQLRGNNNTERLRINSSGSIQITPEGSTSNPYMLIDTSGDSVRFNAQKGSGNNEFRFLTQSSGTVTERLRIDSNGYLTKTNTPFVMVTINSRTDWATTGSFMTIPWDTIHGRGTNSNVGNHFNTSNHRFTAPIAGRYLFVLSLNIVGDNILYHRINGSNVSGGEYRMTQIVWDHLDASFIYDMNANDYYDCQSRLYDSSGKRWNGGNSSEFGWDTLSIYLLG